MKNTSVGYKIVTALTGLLLVGFLVGHLAGNLLFFAGSDAINDYAKKLKSMPALIWTARLGLLGLIVTHIVMTISLRRKVQTATQRYHVKSYRKTTRASRWMMLSGSAVLAFVLIHLSHFTLQWIFVESPNAVDEKGRHDVYTMIVDSFRNPFVVVIYVASMSFVMLHLKHALFSVVQTLGIGVGSNEKWIRRFAFSAALILFVGFVSIPMMVLLGIVGSELDTGQIAEVGKVGQLR